MRAIDRGSWRVTKKKKTLRERPRECCHLISCLTPTLAWLYGIFLVTHIIWRTRVVSDSLLRCWTLIVIMRLSRVRESKVTVALASRSISQDRLWYCYWCRYLVRHNWILKYNITHSSCWGFDISISLLMHIQVDVVKCKCVREGGGETGGNLCVNDCAGVVVVVKKHSAVNHRRDMKQMWSASLPTHVIQSHLWNKRFGSSTQQVMFPARLTLSDRRWITDRARSQMRHGTRRN